MDRRTFSRNIAVASAAAALSPFSIVRAQAQKLRVGVILPKSGYLSFIGQSCQKGADLAPGVIKDMLGVDIELMNADFESNVDTARTRAERRWSFRTRWPTTATATSVTSAPAAKPAATRCRPIQLPILLMPVRRPAPVPSSPWSTRQ